MMTDRHSLPISLKLAGRPIVLVGDGPIADAYRRRLEKVGARIVPEGANAALAVVIDDGAAVSRLKVRGALVCAVDRPDLSDFTFPEPGGTGRRRIAAGVSRALARIARSGWQRMRRAAGASSRRIAAPLAGAASTVRTRFPGARQEHIALDVLLARGGPFEELPVEMPVKAEHAAVDVRNGPSPEPRA